MKLKFRVAMVLALALSLAWATGASAALTVFNSRVPAGFGMLGYIQDATVTNAANPNSGGTLTINGIKMIVPANTVIQMPANTLKWADLFNPLVYNPVRDPLLPAQPVLAITAGKTGLAMNDNAAQVQGLSPWLPFNASVEGNIDVKNATGNGGGAYIVGLILPIDQDLENTGQGFVTYIDYAKGRFEVGGLLNTPNTGTVIEINDPLGRFGWAHSPDPRWSVDSDNPTVTTGNGYPMGLPKQPAPGVDPDRPYWNRPLNPAIGAPGHDPFLQAGAPLQAFFMPARSAPNPPGVNTPDPWRQVPIMVGDYVDFAGVLCKNIPTAPINPLIPWRQQTYISAHTVGSDKLAVYTASGSLATTGPAYMSLARMVVGTGGVSITVPPDPARGILGGVIPLPEPRLNTIIHGWCTDSTSLVDIYAVDVNPVTGVETNRLLGTVLPEPGLAGGKGNKGRFRFDIGKGNFQPTTRTYRVMTRHGQIQLGNQIGLKGAPLAGLRSGQYTAPMFTFQFADAAPGFPVMPNNFNNMPFLFQGEGGNPSVGPLVPFPPFQP